MPEKKKNQLKLCETSGWRRIKSTLKTISPDTDSIIISAQKGRVARSWVFARKGRLAGGWWLVAKGQGCEANTANYGCERCWCGQFIHHCWRCVCVLCCILAHRGHRIYVFADKASHEVSSMTLTRGQWHVGEGTSVCVTAEWVFYSQIMCSEGGVCQLTPYCHKSLCNTGVFKNVFACLFDRLKEK